MLRLRTTICMLAILLCFGACKKDTLDPEDLTSSFSCKIDGQNFTALPLLTDAEFTDSGGFYALGIAGVRVNVGDSSAIVMALVGQNFADVVDGSTFLATGSVLDKMGTGNYSGTNFDASSSETMDASITITSIDKENNLISGTFEFTCKDPDTGTSYTVTDGEFSDLNYD